MIRLPSFWGSLKGKIVEAVVILGTPTQDEIQKRTSLHSKMLNSMLDELCRDGTLSIVAGRVCLADLSLESQYKKHQELLDLSRQHVCPSEAEMNLQFGPDYGERPEGVSRRSAFYKVARILTVQDIMEPLGPDLKDGMTSQSAMELLRTSAAELGYDFESRVSLVWRGTQLTGFTKAEYLREYPIIGSQGTVVCIDQTRAVLEEANLLSFLELLASDNTTFVVVKEKRVVGSIGMNDLTKLPFRLCLLGTFLDLEHIALFHALREPQRAFGALNRRRRKRLLKLLHRGRRKWFLGLLNGRPPMPHELPRLLESSYFSDKIEMLKGILPKTWQVLYWVFDRAVAIRNACAHDAPDERLRQLLTPANLRAMVIDLRAIRHELAKPLSSP